MTERLFELDLSGPRAQRVHAVRQRTHLVDIERDFPWESLDAGSYDPQLLELARLGWTENAFNEFCTGAAMGQLITLMGQAQVPLDLWGIACTFPEEELLHVELCSRVAMRLGGGMPLVYDSDDLVLDFEPGLSELQKVNEMIVRLCCVGEVFSLPMLVGSMRAATHPLTRAVLEQIVRDESAHGRLGWLYLDWIGPRLDEAERRRLSRAAEDTAGGLRRVWERLRVRPHRPLPAGYSDIGWMEPADYLDAARDALSNEIVAGLAQYGIEVDLTLPTLAPTKFTAPPGMPGSAGPRRGTLAGA